MELFKRAHFPNRGDPAPKAATHSLAVFWVRAERISIEEDLLRIHFLDQIELGGDD